MKLGKKVLVAALAVAMLASVGAMVAGCGDSSDSNSGNTATAVTLVDTYQSQTRLKYFTVAEDRDFYICETYTVELYSDNTYVCAINISECQQKLANFEYDIVNIIKPLAVTTFTRTGTYTMTKDESVGSFELTLSKATRLTYATNAGGGHYPVVPTNGARYFDSADADSVAEYETEWYGKWSDLENLVGAEVTLTGDTENHMFDAGCMVFDYKSCMFVTLLNRDDVY
jgi:hypothetical protein